MLAEQSSDGVTWKVAVLLRVAAEANSGAIPSLRRSRCQRAAGRPLLLRFARRVRLRWSLDVHSGPQILLHLSVQHDTGSVLLLPFLHRRPVH